VISIAETRAILGAEAVGKSDEQLAVIREQTYACVRQIVTMFQQRRHGTQKQGPARVTLSPVRSTSTTRR
jgi:hypothetical protein